MGRNRVVFTPPAPEMTEQQRTDPRYHPPQSKFAGLVPRQPEVEVKSGGSTIDIELVRK